MKTIHINIYNKLKPILHLIAGFIFDIFALKNRHDIIKQLMNVSEFIRSVFKILTFIDSLSTAYKILRE